MVMISNFMLSIVNEFNVYRSIGEIYSHLHRHSRKALFLSKAVSRWMLSLWQKGVSPATTCFDICLVDPSLQAHWFFSGETSQHTVRLLSAMLGHHGEEVISEIQFVPTMTSTSCDESEKCSFVHIPLPTTVTLQVEPISLSSPLVSTEHQHCLHTSLLWADAQTVRPRLLPSDSGKSGTVPAMSDSVPTVPQSMGQQPFSCHCQVCRARWAMLLPPAFSFPHLPLKSHTEPATFSTLGHDVLC